MSQLRSPKCATGASFRLCARVALTRLVPCFVGLALVAACNSKGGTTTAPAAPTPATAVPAAPAGLTVGALVMKDRTAAISWGASGGATEYIAEVGSTPGGSDVGVQSAGAATSFTLRDLRAGRSYVRLKARNNSGTSAASPEVTFVLPDLADYVEALFLGSGPLIPESNDPNLSCPRRGMWSAFPRGTTIRNRVSAQIPAHGLAAIRATLDQVSAATAGVLAMTLDVVPEDAPAAGDNQVVHVALRSAGELTAICGSPTVACIGYQSRPFTGGVIRWSAGYYDVTNIQGTVPYAHELGHGLFGMCHINQDGIGGSQQSMMSAGPIAGSHPSQLSPFDIEAAQAVYGSSVAIGASRSGFVAAGLLRP